MKLHTLSSLVSLEKPKTPMPNKVILSCGHLLMTKLKIKKILKSYSSVEILKINSIISFKTKKISSPVIGKKYTKVYSIKKDSNIKKFILSFKHGADRNLFLSEIGIE